MMRERNQSRHGGRPGTTPGRVAEATEADGQLRARCAGRNMCEEV